MSIERIKEEAAKADQMIRDLAQGDQAVVEAEEDEDQEAAQPEVEQQTDQGVVVDAATEDHHPDAELDRIREESAKWEQRYRSLHGMIEARDRQIEQLHQLLAGMQREPVSEQPETPKQSKKQLVGKEDEESFGADLIDLARRVAKEESNAYVDALESKIAELTNRLQGVAQTTAISAQERFESQLERSAPNWREIDTNPKFIEWLQSNGTRMRVFTEAARSQDVEGVAYFYQEFGATQPAQKPKTNPQLEKQLAPGKSKATATAARNPQDKKQWTRSEIADFYANGRKQYSPDEYNRLERDLFAAQKENRVDFTR